MNSQLIKYKNDSTNVIKTMHSVYIKSYLNIYVPTEFYHVFKRNFSGGNLSLVDRA